MASTGAAPSEYDRVVEARDFLSARRAVRLAVGVVLGSGLGSFAEAVEDPTATPYDEIPHWPRGGVSGHPQQWIAAHVANVPVAVLAGRAHLYEGFSARQVVFGIRVLGLMGVRSLILTNASGAVNESLQPGRLALIADHINLQGTSPLWGPNDGRWGLRFPDLTDAYDAEYRELARKAAAEIGFDLPEGVYAGVPGPNYETPSEVRFLRTIGADMVGMSAVQETVAARHIGMRVLGLSVVSTEGQTAAERRIERESSPKIVASQPWPSYPISTGTLKTEIPANAKVRQRQSHSGHVDRRLRGGSRLTPRKDWRTEFPE